MKTDFDGALVKRHLVKRATATFAPAVLLASIGALTFSAMRAEERAMLRIAEANEVTNVYQELLGDLRDMQTSLHAYVATGAISDFGRYDAAQAETLRDRTDLRARLQSDDLPDWPQLDSLLVAMIQISSETIKERQSRPARAAALLSDSRGERILSHVQELVEREIALEKREISQSYQARRKYVTLLTVLVPLVTLLAALVALVLNRALAQYGREEEAQRKLAEQLNQKLSAREARFRALIEHSHDIVAILNSDMSLAFVSPSIERVLGYAPDELMGKTGILTLHPDDRGAITSVADAARATPGRIVRGTLRLQAKSGEWRLFDYSAVDMLNDPAVQGLVYNARDITQQQRLQEQLLQSQKMEAVGRLAGGIAHDFNNLITTIKGNLTFATDALEQQHPARADLAEVDAAADHALSLTRQLLAFSRKQVLESRVVDSRSVVEHFERMVRRVIGENVVLQTKLPAQPHLVLVDPGQLEQVLMNLVVNARDAMTGGGTITIAVGRAIRDAARADGEDSDPGEYVLISVADTGSGMTPDVQARIFEPFFTTKQRGSGTGLGLAMVYGIVKQSHGHLEVDSTPGRGTTFHIYLPLMESVASKEEPSPAMGRLQGDETVLVVEDEPTVRALACRALRSKGYQVLEAADGQQALQMLESVPAVHLMLSDAVMPGLHGLQLARIVMRQFPDVRIILMSGYSDTDMGDVDAGIEWLEKPFTIDVLARKVRTVLGGA